MENINNTKDSEKYVTLKKLLGDLSILLLFLLPLVTATSIYSGETFTLDVSETYDFYSIVGNITPIQLEITQIGNQIYITPDKYSLEDYFKIVFFNKEKEVITIYSGGGGSGSIKYIEKNITEYIPVETIKEIQVEKEIEKEIEVETNKIPIWIRLVIIFLVLLVFYIWKANSNTDERRYKDE